MVYWWTQQILYPKSIYKSGEIYKNNHFSTLEIKQRHMTVWEASLCLQYCWTSGKNSGNLWCSGLRLLLPHLLLWSMRKFCQMGQVLRTGSFSATFSGGSLDLECWMMSMLSGCWWEWLPKTDQWERAIAWLYLPKVVVLVGASILLTEDIYIFFQQKQKNMRHAKK